MDSTQIVERTEIKSMTESAQSLMPEGLLSTVPADVRRDLIAYLLILT